MTFDPASAKVTCVTLPKDHCVQVPWDYINVCGYSDQFCKILHTLYIPYILHTYYIQNEWSQSLSEHSSGETKRISFNCILQFGGWWLQERFEWLQWFDDARTDNITCSKISILMNFPFFKLHYINFSALFYTYPWYKFRKMRLEYCKWLATDSKMIITIYIITGCITALVRLSIYK